MDEARATESKRLFAELWLVMNQITRGVQGELAPFGLTHAQFQVLLTVDASPDISQRELSERLNVTTGNISMLVTKLEQAGLVDRIPDGAAHRLRLTEAGEERLHELAPTRSRFIRELFSPLSVEEIRTTSAALRRIRGA
ncbi:MAG: MarR family winged helix-turn-helix transcriptional regulator [Motilibacteraceae bacterium]